MYRFREEYSFRNFKKDNRTESIDTYWDDDYDLVDPGGWEARYTYENKILNSIIRDLNIQKILELGSGPGTLANKIIDSTGVDYTMLDGESAKRAHKRRGHKGKFIVKDLYDSFDTTGLDTDYYLVIANDFLEHIRNPSLIVNTVRNITRSNSYFFISSPSWRMKHQYFYPGLFDFDNLVKFMLQEGYVLEFLFDSWSQRVHIQAPRLSSESSLPEGHLLDWNYYMLYRKLEND